METNSRTCPYVGLTPFTEDDAEYFFGREDETRRIASKLYAARLTLLYGASGVGKSSVLRAGVLKSLRDDNVGAFYFNTWQSDPVAMLRESIGGEIPILLLAQGEVDGNTAAQFAECFIAGRDDVENEITRFADRLRAAPSLGDFIKIAAERVGALMIILDQFEEYFLYHPRDDAGNSFALEFAQALNRDDVPASFLIGIREDAYTKLDRFKGRIPNLFANYTHLAHLNTAAARAAIEKPLEKFNALHSAVGAVVSIEPALVDAVLEQVRTGQVKLGAAGSGVVTSGRTESEATIETPFLQLVMTRLWEEETGAGSRTLKLVTLNRLGGAEKIVRTHLDGVMEKLSAPEQDASALFFDRLVTPSGTKIAQTTDDLAAYAKNSAEQVAPVLKTLTDARVLRSVAPPMDQPTAIRYEIFHDVLAPAVLDWRRRYVEKQERAREQQRVRRLRFAFLGAAALLLVFAALSIIAFQQKTEADAARQIALARQLAISSVLNLDTDSERSLLIAMQSINAAYTQEGEDSLRQAIGTSLVRFTLRGHTSGIGGVAFSPDGKQIVTTSGDKTARLWDATNGLELAVLRGHTDYVSRATYSPDGKQIVTASGDKTARVWDAATGREVAGLLGHTAIVTSAAFSPDGKQVVTASEDATARLWDSVTGRERAVLLGHTSLVRSAAFSPDGKQVITASTDNTARIWDAATGRELVTLRGHTNYVWSAAWSPDGKQVVTSSGDATARLWDSVTGRELAVLSGYSAIFSSNGKQIVTASDFAARVWDTVTRREVAVLQGTGMGFVYSAEFSPDGKQVVTTSYDGIARLWDVATERALAVLRGHPARIAVFSPDGKQVVTASADTANLWDTSIGRELKVLQVNDFFLERVEFSPDGKQVLASGEGTAHLLDFATGQEVAALRGYRPAFSRDGKQVVTVSADYTASVWNTATGRELAVLRGHTNIVHSAAFSPDGKQIVTVSGGTSDKGGFIAKGDDNSMRLWDAATGRELAILRGHTDSVLGAAFSPDGNQIVTASLDKTARIWDVATRRELTVLRGHTFGISYVEFSPDGKTIVTASSDTTARVWDVAIGRELSVLRGHTSLVYSAVFSPDGKQIATASDDKTARVWDASTGRELFALRGHIKQVNSAVFSPDGKRVVTASEDETARIWDASNGREIAILHGHTERVKSAMFSPDGKYILTASYGGTVRVYLVRIEDLMALARTRVTRELTCEEREKFLHEPPCPTPTPSR